MGGIILSLSSLLLGAFVFLLGNGLMGTLLSVRIGLEGFGADVAGYVSSAYFIGFILGTLRGQAVIVAVGHIRAFAAFAGLSAASAILSGLFFDPLPLGLFRAIGGFSIAGLFIVTESWLNGRTATPWRGRVLSIYMLTTYSAMGLGQLLLIAYDPLGVELFALIGLLFALSLVPIALSRVPAPPLPPLSHLTFRRLFRISPMGIIGSFSSGLILGAFYALFPLIALGRGGLDTAGVAILMAIVILFGLFIQWPVGWLSDRTDRRYVMIGGLFAVFVACGGILWLQGSGAPVALWIVFGLLFAFAFTIYPLGVAHTNDFMTADDLVAASGGLLLAYSVGAAIGPAIAGQAVILWPDGGLLYYLATVAVLTGSFAIFRVTRRPPAPAEEQAPFVVVPRTTAVVSELDPRVGDNPRPDDGESLARDTDSQ